MSFVRTVANLAWPFGRGIAWGNDVFPADYDPRPLVIEPAWLAYNGGVVAKMARAIRKAGAGVWFLPPYSPDLNPIEKIWAKVKAWLRKAQARTTQALWDALAQGLQNITPQDCQNSFAHCGYPAAPVGELL